MRKRFLFGALSIMCLMAMSLSAPAQRRVYPRSNQTVRQSILRLENRSALFASSIQGWSDQNYNQPYGANEDINLFARNFGDSVRRFHERFDRRQATASDAQEVLNRAALLDDFLRRNNVDARSQQYWSAMRVDLNQLANAYRINWPQSAGAYPTYGNPTYGNPVSSQLTGTFRIDLSRSDDPARIADQATGDLSPSEQRRLRDSIIRRLESPDQLAIDVRGHTVTLASTRAPQITFEADGRERVETTPSGRTVHSRVTLTSNQLSVSSTGDTGNEFTATFDPLDSGQRLNVIRRVYVQGLSRPVAVQSTYDKISQVAQFNIYNPQTLPTYPTSAGGFLIPDGARVVGVLDDALSTSTAAVGDRFTLRVNEPAEFAGATIGGHVSHIERSGRLTGRSVMTLDFDDIRLRDGRSYRFAGIVEAVRSASGETVRVDTEGTVRDDSQTRKTEERAAIGTAVGAIIGAIAGGGKGAAIGAIVGAGGGAGSVYVQGRNDLDLGRGSEITIRSGAPANTPR
jgi:hypothetical protein